MRTNLFRIFCLLSLVLAVVACEKNESHFFSGKSISIELTSADNSLSGEMETKSGFSKNNSYGQFVLISEDNRALALSHEVEDMPVFESEPHTKAARYNSESEFKSQEFGLYCWNVSNSNEVIYSNEKVSKTNGKWSPQMTKLWPSKNTLNFEAVYPRPAATLGTVGLTSLTPSPTLSDLQFSYKVPTKATDEEDLMFACYSGFGDQGKAPLIFTHALACVKFKLGTIAGISSINSITLSGVYKEGNCNVAVEEGGFYSYNWTPSGKTTVSNDVKVTTLTSGTDLGDDYTFLILSQDLEEDAVTVKVNFTDTEGYSFDASVTLSKGKWETGKANIYTIGSNGDEVSVAVADNVTDGKTMENLVISNTGTAKEYIRVAIIAGWYNEEGEMVAACNLGPSDFSGFPGSGWVAGVDGFYYYANPVEAGKTTGASLFESYTSPVPPVPEAHLEMQVLAQAVIYDSSKVRVSEAWGATAAGYLNN